MRTVVISDLHLGTTNRADLLRRDDVRAELVAALRPGDRLVLLGDSLELREVPVREAAPHAEALLAEAGAAIGAAGEVVIVGGNHDHGLVAGWIESRLGQSDPPVLGLEHLIEPADGGPLAERLAAAAGPARVRLAYPGLWLRDDVYAFHGHYLDLHATVPTFERLAAGAMARWVAPLPEGAATPDDYERVLAPIYAWIHALAQRAAHGVVRSGAGSSARVWAALANGGRRDLRTTALNAGFVAAVAGLNRAGIGPVRRDLSPRALRQSGLRAVGETVRRLGIGARHVVWGHSHRAGPFPSDDRAEWTAPTGARLHNAGSWVFQPHFLRGEAGRSPYWPGTAVVVEAGSEPQLVRLLADRTLAELRPTRA